MVCMESSPSHAEEFVEGLTFSNERQAMLPSRLIQISLAGIMGVDHSTEVRATLNQSPTYLQELYDVLVALS